MRVVRLAVAVWAVVVSAEWAQGQMTYFSQSRSVSAETNAGAQSFSTTNLLEWNNAASSSNPIGSAYASAWQISDVRANRIALRSHTGASNMNGYLATCTSSLDVSFRLFVATPYEIIQDPLRAHGSSIVQLTMGATTIFSFHGTAMNGVLEPGAYRMQANLESTAPWSGPDWLNDQDASFILTVPAPGAAATLLVGLSVASSRRRR